MTPTDIYHEASLGIVPLPLYHRRGGYGAGCCISEAYLRPYHIYDEAFYENDMSF